MVAKSLKWAPAWLVIFPPAALALGLGDIRLNSSLNAPLDADIELVGATPDELASLKPQIASRDTFARYGLDWPSFLANVTLRPVHTPDGRDVIKLHSSEAITEPFITLLVELNWDRGRVVREYTVLLDPPVYTPNQEHANAPVAAPAAGTGQREGGIARPAPAETAKSATAATPAPAAGDASAESATHPAAIEGGTYKVARGDTLSHLATRYAGSNTVDAHRWMVATYQANTGAFQSNMNLMRSGAVLRLPDQAAVAAVTPADAAAELHRQYSAWHAAPAGGASAGATPTEEQAGRLRLVTPAEAPAAGAATAPAPAGTGPEVKALEAKVHDLQSQLDESHRLLDVQNGELAQLQAKLKTAGTQQAPAATQAAPPPVAQTSPPASPVQPPAAKVAEPAPSVQPPPPAETAAAPPVETATAPPPPKPAVQHKPLKPAAAPQPAPSGSWLDPVRDYGWVLGLLVIAGLALYGLRAWRSRRATGFDDSLGRLAAAGAASLTREREREPKFDATPQVASVREDNFLVEESGVHQRPQFDSGAGAAPAPAARHVSADETISSETAINLDQGDPLAEADFHMAYGLYDQAADLVRIAIQREPERRDLQLKLLEVFFVWGNKDQFLQTARELAGSRANAAPGEWEKIVIMGKQLAPEDPLFAGGAGVSGAAAAGVDLDLEGGQSRVDFDVLGDPIAPPPSDGVDLDIGTAIGERDPAAEQAALQSTDRNLALHDDDTIEREVTTATTRQMPVDRGDEASPEAPTVEQPALQVGDNPTIRQKLATALKHGGAAENTTELALDDLGLDLGALDNADQPALGSTPDSPTMVAGLDEHSRRLMETAAMPIAGNGAGTSETGSYHLDADTLGDMDTGSAAAHAEPAATMRVPALKNGGTLDFDIGEPEQTQVARNGAGGVDLDVGTATVPDVAFTATQRLGADDLALPDLEPVTMSEVGTKLDLARAYMDMGDPEGARNILEEVLTEGSVAQKQEAQRLIASLPG
jgi:pilus assembly protein FimV